MDIRPLDPSPLGQSLPRLEDERFITGAGRYVDDIEADGEAHAFVVRSPHSHASIKRIDATAARATAGVLGVFTEADLRADQLGPLPCMTELNSVKPLIVPPRHALARDRVRHVGDPVALVVAATKDAARDAAELVEIDYDPLPPVVDAVAALADGAPALWNEASRNLAFEFRKGDEAATKAAFATAPHQVALELVNNRVVVAPIEPRAAIGRYDAATQSFHLLLTGQGVHGIRRQLAEFVFKIPPERLHLSAPDVGGGFGAKNFAYPEWVLVLWAARRLGRAVRWVSDRAEDFVSSAHGRDNHTRARLALDAAGRFLALEVETVANLGAYLSSNGPGSSTNATGTAMGGPYAIPAISLKVLGVFTNTVPVDAYRGAGKPEANYIIERLVELAARKMRLDPIALRRRNLIAEFPYRTAMGMTIDGGRFADNLDDAVVRADIAGFAGRRAASVRSGRLRGLGVACFLETARGTPNESAAIRFDADGRVTLAVGTQSNGQGHETSYPQIAASRLGLPISVFRYVQADTRRVASGAGHGGARSMHLGGAALVMATEQVIEKGRVIAARLLQASPAELSFGDGRFVVKGTGREIGLLAVAQAANDPGNLPEGVPPGLDTTATRLSDVYSFPNGCHVAEVEIDPDTGSVVLDRYTAVDDFGRLINPALTADQVYGGVAQGIGQAMLERVVYDPQSGQLLSGSLMDYALPRAEDLPSFDLMLSEARPTEANPLGVKGSGQAGAIAAPQTLIHAVLDALAPLGVGHIDMPVTPESVWRAIEAARRRAPPAA